MSAARSQRSADIVSIAAAAPAPELEPRPAAPKPKPDLEWAGDIYRHDKAKRENAAHWARVHVRGDRREPIWLPDRPRCHRLMRRLFSFEGRQ